jgi:hypothetical protein
MYKKGFLYICIALLPVSAAYSQSDSVYILPELRIYQKENNKTICYVFEEYKENKFILNDSFLTADPSIYNYSVNLNELRTIKFHDGTHWLGGAATGAAFGYIVGFFLGAYFTFGDSRPGFQPGGALIGGLVLSVPFGLIGGVFGLLSPKYDDYELNKTPDEGKRMYLNKIFNEHRLKK